MVCRNRVFEVKHADKGDILAAVDDIEINANSVLNLNVADANVLATNNVEHSDFGYEISDEAGPIQGEIISGSDIGVLADATSVNVNGGGSLVMSVAEYNALTTDTDFNAQFSISDTREAIQNAVNDMVPAVTAASTITLEDSGCIQLDGSDFGAFSGKISAASIELKDSVSGLNSISEHVHEDVLVIARLKVARTSQLRRISWQM